MSINIETYALAKKNAKKQIDEALSSVYSYKGSVNTIADLPSLGNKVGDTYNVVSEGGQNFAWNGTEWDPLGVNQSATESAKGLVQLATAADIENGNLTKTPHGYAVKTYVENKISEFEFEYATDEDIDALFENPVEDAEENLF